MDLLHYVAKLAVLPYGVVSRERRRGLVILVYHRVGGHSASDIDLPVAEFARQMAYLRRHCALVSMDDVVALAASGRPDQERDLVAVTFDDGYEDTYRHAFPVLVRHQIPATVYVTTRYIETRQAFDFGDFARHSSRPRPLGWSQAQDMIRSGLITIGAHTHSHADLTRLTPREARAEVERSYQLITDRLGVVPRHFAYPWGRVTADVRAVVGQYFQTAVRGGCGKNPYGTIDRLALWRRPIQQSDFFWLFRLKLASYLDGEEYFRTLASRLRGLGPRGKGSHFQHRDRRSGVTIES